MQSFCAGSIRKGNPPANNRGCGGRPRLATPPGPAYHQGMATIPEELVARMRKQLNAGPEASAEEMIGRLLAMHENSWERKWAHLEQLALEGLEGPELILDSGEWKRIEEEVRANLGKTGQS